jgi:acyl-CoA reductase-like NAD-dependent aldehyde dehydrogenase
MLVLQAYKTSWGLKCPGVTRGKLLNKLADLLEANTEELAALESLDVGEYTQSFVPRNGTIMGVH